MIKAETLKEKYEQIKKMYPDKEQYLLGWVDCILYVLGEQENVKRTNNRN